MLLGFHIYVGSGRHGVLDNSLSTSMIFPAKSPPETIVKNSPELLELPMAKKRSSITLHQGLPSGEHTKSYGKSPFLMGKSTISMAMFHCYVSSPEGSQ